MNAELDPDWHHMSPLVLGSSTLHQRIALAGPVPAILPQHAARLCTNLLASYVFAMSYMLLQLKWSFHCPNASLRFPAEVACSSLRAPNALSGSRDHPATRHAARTRRMTLSNNRNPALFALGQRIASSSSQLPAWQL